MGTVPGQVLAALVDTGVGLFRADERVFEAMLDGWKVSVAPTTLLTPASSTSVPTGYGNGVVVGVFLRRSDGPPADRDLKRRLHYFINTEGHVVVRLSHYTVLPNPLKQRLFCKNGCAFSVKPYYN